MVTLLIIFTIIIAILLVLLIMVQNPKGGGLSSTFGGGASVGGVQNTNTFLDNSTWILAGSMVFLILLVNLIHPKRSGGNNIQSSINQTIEEVPAAPTKELPATTSSSNQPTKSTEK